VTEARELSIREGSTFVPPFDHPDIIAGQGTLGLELAAELADDIETVVVPVGGGGLISGVSMALKSLRPNLRVVGVEAANAPTMSRALREGRPVSLDNARTMADGIAMREVSDLTLEHVRNYVDEVVLVTEEEISQALLLLLERAKAVVEPGGAVSLAAVLAGEVPGDGPVCAILSGGNVDPALLMKLIDHGLTAAGRYLVIRVVVNDEPGSLARIARIIADMTINIVQTEHHRAGRQIEADDVEIQFTLETRNRSQHGLLIETLRSHGFHADLVT